VELSAWAVRLEAPARRSSLQVENKDCVGESVF